MNRFFVLLSAFLFVSCRSAEPPASFVEATTNRACLRQVDQTLQSDRCFFALPPQTRLDLDSISLATVPLSDSVTAGSTMVEVETTIYQYPNGTKAVFPKLKKLTLSIAHEQLKSNNSPPWEFDGTIAHELGHAYLATQYPLIYVKSGDFNLIEGHAVTVQFRWLQRNVPNLTEEGFLNSRTAEYRRAYLYFKNNYMRDGHVVWEILDKKELQLSSLF